MFSKLFGFFSLKRKFASTEEANTNIAESSNRPTKRVRIEEPSSTFEDLTQQTSPVQDACITDDEEEELEVLDEIIPRGMKGKEVERLEDLEEEVKETRAIAAQLREETRNYVESIDRTMDCVVCLDFIRNAQVLPECGHTVCYPCLRTWFTRDTEDDDDDDAASMISTDAESDGENMPQPGPSNATPPPPRRHRFHSATNRKKVCPECSEVVTLRPLPLFRLRYLADALNGSESPVPSAIQPRRRTHKMSKRKDLWHGIFHPQSDDNKTQSRLDLENPERAVADQGRDPVVEQAEAILEDRNLEWVRWQGAMDEAREEGRRQMMRQLRRDQERLHEERRRRPGNLFDEQLDQDEPIERRMRGLPVRQDRALVPPFRLAPAAPIAPPLPPPSSPIHAPAPPRQQWIPFALSRAVSPTQHHEFWSGTDDQPPPRTYPIFVIPPPAPPAAGPSNVTRSPAPSPSNRSTQATSAQRSPSPRVLESLQQLRRQYTQPSPRQTAEDVDDDHYSDSGDVDEDEDLPLFTAMMQQTPNPPPNPDSEREYPVYAEDLNLEEDLPQEAHAMEVDLPIIIDDDGRVGSLFAYGEDRGAVQEPEEDEESVEERLSRLVREGEQGEDDGGGIDLE